MKFFWKIFLSAITVTVFTFSIGSTLLIQSVFDTAVLRETQAAANENEALRNSFFQRLSALPNHGEWTDNGPADEVIAQIARNIRISTGSGTIPFSICGADRVNLYSGGEFSPDASLLESIPAQSRGTAMIRRENRRFIAAVCAVSAGKMPLYLVNYREITSLFDVRAEQFRMLERILFALIAVNGVVFFLLSAWLTRPVGMLSRAARRMADGDFGARPAIRGKDEIGMLSQDFNTMADRLEESIRELKKTADRQETFIAGFAHELKTPLTSIIGYADMLRSKPLPEEQRFLFADYIFREGRRLETLSLNLMELILLKKREFPMKKIRASAFLESVRRTAFPVLEAHGLSLSLTAEDALLTAEPALLESVLLNLIDNARKASPPGSGIRVEGKRTTQGYCIQVCDRGRGISKEDLPKITEAFYMADKSRARAEGGAGLGLSLCAAIMERHRGKMRFESEPGKGTRVTLLLREAEP